MVQEVDDDDADVLPEVKRLTFVRKCVSVNELKRTVAVLDGPVEHLGGRHQDPVQLVIRDSIPHNFLHQGMDPEVAIFRFTERKQQIILSEIEQLLAQLTIELIIVKLST